MMNPHSADSAVGGRLREAREAAGYSLADVSTRLKMPVRIVQALEAGDWDLIGAAVFVRGHLRSYARLLGVEFDEAAVAGSLPPAAEPPLVTRVHVPRYRYVAENLARRAVYVVMTLALAVPVWLATRSHFDGAPLAVEPLDLPPGALPAPATPSSPTPMIASMAPLPSRQAEAPARAPLVLEFSGDSWVQVFGVDGDVLYRGLQHAGERRELVPGEVSQVVVGNTAAARLQRDGGVIDLAPYTRANVARFTLSSDGSPAPIAP